MLPKVLLPETEAHQDGVGSEIALEGRSTALLLTLGITRIIEEESLEVSIWGSPDGKQWQQILAFPQKFYCGTYTLLLDLVRHPRIRRVRAHWKMDCWGRESNPLFNFYVFAEDVKVRHAGAA